MNVEELLGHTMTSARWTYEYRSTFSNTMIPQSPLIRR